MLINDKVEKLNIETRIFINGCYCDAHSQSKYEKRGSYDGRELPSIICCDEEDATNAVSAAKRAFDDGSWRRLSLRERGAILLKYADLMEKNIEELALLDTVETSRAYHNYRYDSLPKAIEAVRYYSEAADKTYENALPARSNAFSVMTKIPLGVVGIITPWNDPMVVEAWKYTPALLMGNSVVLKPAEQSSYSAIKIAALMKEAGVPDGVFNVITGDGKTGRLLALNDNVRGIFFTGSSEIGKKIIEYSGRSNMKKVGLECGGKSPFIVSEKYSDIKGAAETLAENIFYNQGQICSGPSRAFVQESVYEKFLECLKTACEKYVPGNPFDDQNEVGCVVDRTQFEKVNGYVAMAREEGAKVYQAKNKKDILENSCCIQPTIITGLNDASRVVNEEIFGPVVTVIPFNNIEEAIKKANDTEFGLAGAIFSDDIDEAYYAANSIDAGLVHINSYGEDEVSTPFGGIKQSGVGKDRSVYAFDEYTQLKTIWFKPGKAYR